MRFIFHYHKTFVIYFSIWIRFRLGATIITRTIIRQFIFILWNFIRYLYLFLFFIFSVLDHLKSVVKIFHLHLVFWCDLLKYLLNCVIIRVLLMRKWIKHLGGEPILLNFRNKIRPPRFLISRINHAMQYFLIIQLGLIISNLKFQFVYLLLFII